MRKIILALAALFLAAAPALACNQVSAVASVYSQAQVVQAPVQMVVSAPAQVYAQQSFVSAPASVYAQSSFVSASVNPYANVSAVVASPYASSVNARIRVRASSYVGYSGGGRRGFGRRGGWR